MKLTTNSPQETYAFAKEVAGDLQGTNVIALYGDLGSGKTTFAQGLAKALGIKQTVISPTYILVRTYVIPYALRATGYGRFHHVDLYRLQSAADIKSVDLEELMQDKTNLVAIEWAEKAKNMLPKNRLDIRFQNLGGNRRQITADYLL